MNKRAPRSLLALAAVGGFVLATGPTARAAPIDQLQTLDDIGPNKIPHAGQSRILVVPSRVGRSLTAAEEADLATYYGVGGTFQTYWQTVSRGAYDPVPTLADVVVFDECPIPDRETNCRLTLDDLGLLISGAVGDIIEEMLARARDEQGLDLGVFDANGGAGEPDGYFDGLVVDTDIYGGIALPIGAFGQQVSLYRTSADAIAEQGEPIAVGIVAFVPPDEHEFAHTFGFIDHYDGQGGDKRPTITGLMGHNRGPSLSAYSRMVIGWGDVTEVSGSDTFTVGPVLETGQILKFGTGPRYALLENRSGDLHATVDDEVPGVYLYAVDEDQLPEGELGFLRILEGELYYPNKDAPYLNVNLPLDCLRGADLNQTGLPCELLADGRVRNVTLPSGTHLGTLEVIEQDASGSVKLSYEADAEPVEEAAFERLPPVEPEPVATGGDTQGPGCPGCQGGGAAAPIWLLLGVFWRRRFARR